MDIAGAVRKREVSPAVPGSHLVGTTLDSCTHIPPVEDEGVEHNVKRARSSDGTTAQASTTNHRDLRQLRTEYVADILHMYNSNAFDVPKGWGFKGFFVYMVLANETYTEAFTVWYVDAPGKQAQAAMRANMRGHKEEERDRNPHQLRQQYAREILDVWRGGDCDLLQDMGFEGFFLQMMLTNEEYLATFRALAVERLSVVSRIDKLEQGALFQRAEQKSFEAPVVVSENDNILQALQKLAFVTDK